MFKNKTFHDCFHSPNASSKLHRNIYNIYTARIQTEEGETFYEIILQKPKPLLPLYTPIDPNECYDSIRVSSARSGREWKGARLSKAVSRPPC